MTFESSLESTYESTGVEKSLVSLGIIDPVTTRLYTRCTTPMRQTPRGCSPLPLIGCIRNGYCWPMPLKLNDLVTVYTSSWPKPEHRNVDEGSLAQRVNGSSRLATALSASRRPFLLMLVGQRGSYGYGRARGKFAPVRCTFLLSLRLFTASPLGPGSLATPRRRHPLSPLNPQVPFRHRMSSLRGVSFLSPYLPPRPTRRGVPVFSYSRFAAPESALHRRRINTGRHPNSLEVNASADDLNLLPSLPHNLLPEARRGLSAAWGGDFHLWRGLCRSRLYKRDRARRRDETTAGAMTNIECITKSSIVDVNDDFYVPDREHLVMERRGICSRPREKHCRTDERKIRRCVQLSCTRAKNRDGSSCDSGCCGTTLRQPRWHQCPCSKMKSAPS
ncbi:Uncharacterized protein DBV15_00063 [Temnothorax longispinosus]|uniref:Uncharacterized protein n=1 Tax=Temnothorax longispinosus TaxID=300112 RepID=A0A4S2KIG3_9HYME|nr:Uncharacterized protein DBV15_00063 [Temnothorax longispinosus]